MRVSKRRYVLHQDLRQAIAAAPMFTYQIAGLAGFPSASAYCVAVGEPFGLKVRARIIALGQHFGLSPERSVAEVNS